MADKYYILGADPGAKGAIALINAKYKPDLIAADDVIFFPFSTDKNGILRVEAIRDFLLPYVPFIQYGVLEHVHALGNTSIRSMFTFGYATGMLAATLRVLNIPFVEAEPKIWQKVSWKPEHLVYLPGQSEKPLHKRKRDTKATSLNAFKSIFPGVSALTSPRKKIPHDGCVDAALIAYYGLKTRHQP